MATTAKARNQRIPRAEISSDKARDQLGGLINRASRGAERIVLTRHGLEAAALVSIDDLKRLEDSEGQ